MEMPGGLKGDGTQEFKGLRITSLDDDSDEEEQGQKEQELVMDDDDDEDDEEARNSVILGFVKKPEEAHSLLRHFFPSKAGGVPAWLDPENLPSGRSCFCDICGESLQFLLQVYAEEEKESAFHRTLFVFICTSMACLRRDQHEQWKCVRDKPARSVKVFRCQLPRENPFYSSDPPKESTKPLKEGAALCNWCGTWKGIKRCTGCRKALYCSEKHWVKHSRTGHEHDCQRLKISSQLSDCSSDNSDITSFVFLKVASNELWPEYEIRIEDEPQMPEDSACTSSLVSNNQVDDALMSIAANFEGDDDKRSWASFHDRIALAPAQVLRYCRRPDARPLWPVSSGRPSKVDIPKCSYCAGPLCFEFQIMPQLLFYFNVKNDVDSLDWATIAVYTCEASCDASAVYKEEFAWVQLS